MNSMVITRVKCRRCGKEKEEFVEKCCADCYMDISSELAKQHYKELAEFNERKRNDAKY